MDNNKLVKPGEYTDPPDLVNLGLKCQDCLSPQVIYHITVPAPGWPFGPYCYKCLLARCGATHRIPVPMEFNLMDRIQADLGILHAKKCYLGVGKIGP